MSRPAVDAGGSGAGEAREDLIVRETRLPEGDGVRDIGIAGGRIRRIAPRLAETASSEIAAGGRLVIPGLVESHFHLDKALLGAGAPHWGGGPGARSARRPRPSA